MVTGAALSWGCLYLLINDGSGRRSAYSLRESVTYDTAWGINGDAGLIAAAVNRREAPVGILWDRLEEYPHEAEGASAEDVAAAVAILRRKYPSTEYVN